MNRGLKPGFTIVELLIVVVVIAILAAITIVAYNGISAQAKESALKSELSSEAKKLHLAQGENGEFPSSGPANTSTSTFTYSKTTGGFCLEATGSNKTFHITENSAPTEGECLHQPFVAGNFIQTATTANCPTTRTLAVDARDNHTYWIQKMPDYRCWMLTNLAYAGGGTNTYSDTRTNLQDGTADSARTYTEPKYYISTTHGTLFTTHPTEPSTDTTGGGSGSGRQYGYLYNWCAAMGAQTSTSACANASTPAPDTNVSICPANWRLPTGQPTSGEFTPLNNAINGGLTNTDAGLRASLLAQLGGGWNSGGFVLQGSNGYYWSTTQLSATYAHGLGFSSYNVSPSSSLNKNNGFSVRCIAAM